MSYNVDWTGMLQVEPLLSPDEFESYSATIRERDWPWNGYFEPLNGADPDEMKESLEDAFLLFFNRGTLVNGTLEWQGDSWDDTGTIIVKNNNISVCYARYTSPEVLKLIPTEDLLQELQRRCAVYDKQFDEVGLA